MDQLTTLEFAIGELHREVSALDDSEMDTAQAGRSRPTTGLGRRMS
jgi:hypothetical protein